MDDLYHSPFGDTLRWIAGSDETSAAYSLLERVAPPGSASPGHEHHFAEAFYVIDGEVAFTIGDRKFDAARGTFAIAPDMIQHGWKVTGSDPARILIMFSPAAPREYFADIDRIVREASSPEQIDRNAIAEAARQHGFI